MKVALCTNFISPYRIPTFARLASEPGWRLRVFTSVDREFDRAWDVPDAHALPFEVEPCAALRTRKTLRGGREASYRLRVETHLPIGLPAALRRFRPDVVISAELGARSLLAWATCRTLGVPLVIWSYQSTAGAECWNRHRAMRRFTLRRASAVVGMGSQARRALIELGGDGIPIFDAPNAADVGRLEARLGTVENINAVKSIRQTHAVNGKLAIIVGRLIPMKGIEILLDAWRAVPPAARREWSLVFVGDGPLRELIETQRDLGAAVVGHVPPAQLADWYAAADLHVFPSLGDPWGLVVNEAMTCGVPTLCSDLAGCRDDMIRHDVTGFRFDPSAPAASVAAAIEHALTHPDLATIGKQGRVHAARFAPARMAKGIAIAVEYACRKANRKEVMA